MKRHYPKEKEEKKSAMEKLLKMGVLEPAVSTWATNIVFDKKDHRGGLSYLSIPEAHCVDNHKILPQGKYGEDYVFVGLQGGELSIRP